MRFLFAAIITGALATSANAQSLVGKWTCKPERQQSGVPQFTKMNFRPNGRLLLIGTSSVKLKNESIAMITYSSRGKWQLDNRSLYQRDFSQTKITGVWTAPGTRVLPSEKRAMEKSFKNKLAKGFPPTKVEIIDASNVRLSNADGVNLCEKETS